MQRLYRGVVWRMNPSSKVVYLTFDDGPIPQCTPQVLDILRQYNAKATFFMVAENAERYPELLARVKAEGHSIGNHTYSHMRGHQSCNHTYVANALHGEQILQTRLFRPPHGRMRYSQKRAMLQAGYTIYLWDVLTHDYNPNYTPDKMLRIVQRFTRNGSIITFHDSLKSIDKLKHALPLALKWMREQGYEFRLFD